MEENFEVGRYHSLIVERETLPACLEVSATSDDNLIMALRHRTMIVEGVQFHPSRSSRRAAKNCSPTFCVSKIRRICFSQS
ncbi:MAG: gamma-glutamyl-gamma-aminobutyrate hydrolase family protein [Pyrinomonadaceae bacterium]